MEDFARQLNEILLAKEKLDRRLEDEAEEICTKMYELLFAKASDPHSKTPQQIKKKKRLTAIIDTDDEESFLQRKSKSPNSTKSGRPGRAAKAKAESFLKEPDARTKMRQPHDNNSSISSIASVEITTSRPPTYDLGSSDEERDEFRMPPPKVPSIKSKKIVIKAEKLSFDGNELSSLVSTSSTVSATSSTETLVPDVANSSSASNKSHKAKKTKNHRPIKVERISEVFEEAEQEPSRGRTRSQRISKKNSMESVYEDALPGPIITNNATVNLGPNPNATVSMGSNETMGCNATVNMGPNATVNLGPNATVNMGGNATITLPNKTSMPDATFQVNETVTIGNATTVISKNSEQTFNARDRKSSNIMTEESDEEEFTPMVAKSKKNELFNPCVQSPVKKKVEAFEKAALESPAPRQARPKTRQNVKKTKENLEPLPAPSLKDKSKHGGGTPSMVPKPVVGRFLTPTQSSNITPIIGQKKAPNSTSKIMAFPKMTASSSSSVKSLSRENSAEDVNRGYSKFQQTAEEKKKKREQKQQQAALVREMKEKERLERLEKIRKKEDEKVKPKVMVEMKSKKELDEIQRNLKLAAEKEEQKKRLERQKLEMAEAARKEREHIKEMKKREELEMKRREQQKLMKAKTQHRVLPKYNFDMLHSDDSTDEEDKVSHKRPYPPPSWSLSRNRGPAIDQQAFLSTKYIDSLFSVQPMSVNLEEIFPRIDKKYLKRNSSVIWKTPPRYSEMPKYY